MLSKEELFLRSALTERGAFIGTDELLRALRARQADPRYKVEEVSWKELDGWSFEAATGNLVHRSGKFFSIEGIRVSTNVGSVRRWTQPIIVQPEIGVLGLVAKTFDGVLHVLLHAKMEPGNLGMVQLSPTVQATRSNYTRAHQGASPDYLDFFLDRGRARILVDQLQSEQGARFLRKRNRNMVVEASGEVEALDGYWWLTLGQVQALLKLDNVINMDARSVLSGIPFVDAHAAAASGERAFEAIERGHGRLDAFRREVLRSALCLSGGLHSHDELISWFTELKTRCELEVERIPLKDARDWARDERSIRRADGKYFSVIGVRAQAQDREVAGWCQPMVKPQQEGVIGFLAKRIGGVLHFLVQAKLEPGNLDVVELAPTVQCITGSYKEASPEDQPPFLREVLEAPPARVRYSAFQSEEGGRFYREQNRNIVVEAEDSFPVEVPARFAWMTLGQMNEFIRYNNYFNVEARSLVACMAVPELAAA